MSEQRDEWMKKPEHDREQHAISLVVDAASGEKGKFARWLAEHDRQVAARAWDESAGANVGFESDGSLASPATNPYREGA